MKKLLSVLFIFFASLHAEQEKKVLDALENHSHLISAIARSFGVSPRLVASVIYAERRLNYDWSDAMLDGALGESGYNSSIGFAQMKVNTAFWIEHEIRDRQSAYFLGNTFAIKLPFSKSRSELVSRLLNDSTNIIYCVAYVSMIRFRWLKAGVFLARSNEPGILGTLYSIGVKSADGEDRMPHLNPRMNKLGLLAQEFFDSLALLNVFPQ